MRKPRRWSGHAALCTYLCRRGDNVGNHLLREPARWRTKIGPASRKKRRCPGEHAHARTAVNALEFGALVELIAEGLIDQPAVQSVPSTVISATPSARVDGHENAWAQPRAGCVVCAVAPRSSSTPTLRNPFTKQTDQFSRHHSGSFLWSMSGLGYEPAKSGLAKRRFVPQRVSRAVHCRVPPDWPECEALGVGPLAKISCELCVTRSNTRTGGSVPRLALRDGEAQ